MKRCIILVLLFVSIVHFSYGNQTNQQRKMNKSLKHRCWMGELYYDWKGRPMGVAIPVLDKQCKPVKCNGN